MICKLILTDDGEIDLVISRRIVLEVDSAPVNPVVGGDQWIDLELGRLYAGPHGRPFAEGFRIRPQPRLQYTTTARVHAVYWQPASLLAIPQNHNDHPVLRRWIDFAWQSSLVSRHRSQIQLLRWKV